MMRLDKYLSEAGEGSRQQVKAYIRQGRVEIDGVLAKKPETKVDEGKQKVSLDGREIPYQKYEYYMLNKPAGVITATTDGREQTVLDLLGEKRRPDLFPVGRLDKDTEGLLLITNDGALGHRLLSPRKHVDKCYYARVRGEVTDQDAERFAQGICIGLSPKKGKQGQKQEEWASPAKLEILNVIHPSAQEAEETGKAAEEEEPVSEVLVTIQEGKFHQVKRMFLAVGKKVVYLKRLSMGGLRLDQKLEPGQYRRLTDEEIEKL